ncbi:MAG: PEP-CTERM sorting domain-containing protein [Planctomycetes bacterium]|nr:PEP-CTERM sorting domain-containing protein [Planctomycetota bacterium]
MFRQTLVFILCISALSTLAYADVSFLWEPTTLKAGENETLDLSVRANPGIDTNIYSIELFFSDSDAAIQLKEWRWIPEIEEDEFYDTSSELPDNVWVVHVTDPCVDPLAYCIALPPDGSDLKIGELDVQIEEPGSYILDAGMGRARFWESTVENGIRELLIKGGLQVKLEVVPEPTALGLLLVGTLAAIRRRR